MDALYQAGTSGSFMNGAPYCLIAHVDVDICVGLAGKQVGSRFGIRGAPIIAEFGEQPRAEHNFAVLPAFALTDVNEHARTVDVFNFLPD